MMYIVVCLDRKLKPSKYVVWYFAGHVFLSPDTRTLHLFDGVDILLAPGTQFASRSQTREKVKNRLNGPPQKKHLSDCQDISGGPPFHSQHKEKHEKS